MSVLGWQRSVWRWMPDAKSVFFGRLGRKFTVGDLKKAFCTTLRSPAGERYVLPDLAEFCKAYEPAPRVDSLFVQGRAAGRRDVWLHISELLNLTEEELVALTTGRSIKIIGD